MKQVIEDARANVAEWPTEPDAMSLCIVQLADSNADLIEALRDARLELVKIIHDSDGNPEDALDVVTRALAKAAQV